MQTFQPNSIRSLINKRNSKIAKIQDSNNEITSTQNMSKTCTSFNKSKIKKNDPDLDSILQAKLMIKDIDHDIDSIRIWRQHQKQILQQKFRSNKELSKLSEEEYLKFIQKQLKEDQLVNDKIIQKIKIQQAKLKRPYKMGDDPNSQTLQSQEAVSNQNDLVDSQPYIFDYISQAQKKVQQSKFNNFESVVDDKHQAFLNDINNMSEIFTKKNLETQQSEQYKKNQNNEDSNQKQKCQQKKIDRSLLQKQLQDIQNELKQMEELLKD